MLFGYITIVLVMGGRRDAAVAEIALCALVCLRAFFVV